MKIDDGGPAFPKSYHGHPDDKQNGMSLRDWFAGMALQGYLSCDEVIEIRDAAQHAYAYADAMLKARKESK